MSEPLRILRVTSDLYPDVMGGICLHAHHMSRQQAEMGHDVTVLTSDHGDSSLPRRERRDGYEIVRHTELISPLDNSITPGIAESILRRQDEYDVVHAHSHLFFPTNLAAALSKVADTPLVVTNHGLFSQTAPEWVQKVFIPTVGRFTLNSADVILCYTETDRKRLKERGVSTEIEVIHNGINCNSFSPDPGVQTEDQLLFVGRLKEGKGPEYLLEAFAGITDDYPGVTLKIVGEGPLRDDLEYRCRELDISDRVEFCGYVPNREMPQLYNESSIFVLPSLSEGLPRTVMEALACGTPAITTELPQMEELLDGAGLTVPAKSPAELEDEIRTLLENEERRETMASVGQHRIVNDYSWSETVRRTTEVYRTVI